MSTPNLLFFFFFFFFFYSFFFFFFFFFFFTQSQSQSTNFTFHGFNLTNLLLEGGAAVATPFPGALKLTNTSNFAIGHAFYPSPIPLSTNSSFSTHFIFQIIPSASAPCGGYGLAFTLSPSPSFPNAAGGQYMGVFNSFNDGNSSNHIFMVEFDKVNRYNEKSDSDGNHVGVNFDGMKDPLDFKPASFRKVLEGTATKKSSWRTMAMSKHGLIMME